MVSANKKTHYLELGNTGTKCYSSFLNWTDCKWKIKRSRWDKSNFIHSNDSIAKATNVHRKVNWGSYFILPYATPGQQHPQILMISAEPTDSNLKINHNPFFKQFLSYYCDLHSPTPSFFANGIGLRTNAPVGLPCIPLVLKVINTLLLLRARCLRLHQIEP